MKTKSKSIAIIISILITTCCFAKVELPNVIGDKVQDIVNPIKGQDIVDCV